MSKGTIVKMKSVVSKLLIGSTCFPVFNSAYYIQVIGPSRQDTTIERKNYFSI